jgi:flagellar biosynthesis protein FlhG
MPQLELVTPKRAGADVQVIAISSGKGGTGKTTVAVNLAAALAEAGRKVLLLDGDLGLANVDVLLGLTPACTIEQVLKGERRLEEILLHTPEGIGVIPAASGVTRLAQLPLPELNAVVSAFSTLPASYDTLVIDTAPGLIESVLTFCQAAQHQLLVIRNEPASLTDAYALIKVLSRERCVGRFRILVNMVRGDCEPQRLFQRLQRVTDRFLDVALEYAGEIPNDDAVARAVCAQRTVLAAYPGGPAARAYRRLARIVSAWPACERASGGLQFFLERILARPAARLKVAI